MVSINAHRGLTTEYRDQLRSPGKLLGLTVTLLVVGIELLGKFGPLERETIDLRFAHARWRNEPLDNQIRFVDIDDGALDSVGRWP